MKDQQLRIDNLLAQMWAVLGLNGHLGRAGRTKRSGLSARESVFLLLMWRWLRGCSIAMFRRQSMQQFFQARKDAVYEFFKRQDLNWRGLNYRVARAVYQRGGFEHSSLQAFVIDEVIKSRRGKRMEGVSAHYDHCLGRTVIGQQVVTSTVQLNLETDERKPPRWHQVKLLFVRGLDDKDQNRSKKKNWALFLSTDPQLSAEQMLQVYSIRWSVEVYFKEVKQHLGFLSEQTRSFASFIASIHLCAIRYLLLTYAALSGNGQNVPEVREPIKEQLDMLCFARRLWHYFRSLVCRSIRASKTLTDHSLDVVMQTIDRQVEQFLDISLQLDVLSLEIDDDPAILSGGIR